MHTIAAFVLNVEYDEGGDMQRVSVAIRIAQGRAGALCC